MTEVLVLWIGPGHRIATCVGVPTKWLQAYRSRVVTEWKGAILAVYRPKKAVAHTSTVSNTPESK